MGRPKGSKNRPDASKPGRKPGSTKITKRNLPDAMILDKKVEILEYLSSGAASTLSAAAELAGVKPTNAYSWSSNDPDFHDMIRLAREVVADKLEKELANHPNFIPKMMILKGIRPMYRDSYRQPQEDDKMRELLEQLMAMSQRGQKPIQVEKPDEIKVEVPFLTEGRSA